MQNNVIWFQVIWGYVTQYCLNMQVAQPTFTCVCITVMLVAIIAGTRVTSICVMTVVVATSIVAETLINVCTTDFKGLSTVATVPDHQSNKTC